MPPAFRIRFTGGDIAPGDVAARDLAALLIGAEDAVMGMARKRFPAASEEDLLISLSQIRHDSVGLDFASRTILLAESGFMGLVETIDAGMLDQLPGMSLDGLRILTRFSRERRCQTEFYYQDRSEPVLTLQSDFATRVPPVQYIRGETTLYGTVERVGGVRPRVKLRLANDNYMHCDASTGLAQQLGSRLYTEVGLDGAARWDPRDGSLVYFQAQAITGYDPVDARLAFEELAEASDGEFEGIADLDSFIASLREED